MEGHLDMKIMEDVVEEIREEASQMSHSDLETALSKRYAQKIYAVEQFDAVTLNTNDTSNSRLVRRFKYSPLVSDSDIRLFKFKKFVSSGNLRFYSCEIVHANLDHNPVYIAFSYAWGSIEDTVPVLVGDDQCLMVTRSLEELLISFSHDISATGYYWTDQLCINQYDLQERNKQVGMMRRIYGQAKVTVLWLGEEDEIAKRAFDVVHCFDSIALGGVLQQDLSFSIGSLSAEDLRHKFHAVFPQAVDIPPVEDPRWKDLLSFLGRPWFSRLWVFQEALLSFTKRRAHVACGSLDCSMLSLYLARSLLFVDWEVPSMPPGFQMTMTLMRFYMCRDADSFPPLCYTLWHIGGILHCKDPRDYIYGLLGIQNLGDEVQIPIDYTKSVRDVYTDCIRRLINHDGSLFALEFLKRNHEEQRVAGLPSWVPDWSAEAIAQPIEGSRTTFDPQKGRFSACKQLKYRSSQRESNSDPCLVVKGKLVDTIVCLFQSIDHTFQISTPTLVEKYFTINFPVRKWAMFLHQNMQVGYLPEVTTDELKAIVIRTITADGFNDIFGTQGESATFQRTPKEDALLVYNELERLRQLYESGHYTISGSPDSLHRKLLLNTEVCKGRKLAMLENFWVALGPEEARVGDYICVLHGSTVPWVLRPRDEEGRYEIVGQCFVDGIMYGEALDWGEDEGDTFVLV